MTYLADPCREAPLTFTRVEQFRYEMMLAERPHRLPCCMELNFSFFFDGTNNNRERDFPLNAHSNVARLHDVHPDNLKKGFLPTYIPGVGTSFPEIGDKGGTPGLAFAAGGEARIVWALIQMLNNVHRFFLGNTKLVDFDQAKRLSNLLTEPKLSVVDSIQGIALARRVWLKRQQINSHRREELGALRQKLQEKIAPLLKRKPTVTKIRVSIFGFSRGSAEARAFSNWLVELCGQESPGELRLAGIPVQFDFLGIFDTVASVGLANSSLVADGHMEWAAAETALHIPAQIRKCLHLVSAHEVRRSFPLDSVRVGETANSNCEEIVYPGVHSDLGGGYKPLEQGRGLDPHGHDMLSRIPLAHMYREARLAGVPLDVNGEGVSAEAKTPMQVDAGTRRAFNAYLEQCKTKQGELETIMLEQTRLYISWRKQRLNSMAEVNSVQRADRQDRTDILQANEELKFEAHAMEKPVGASNLQHHLTELPSIVPLSVRAAYAGVSSGVDVFANRGLDPARIAEWHKLSKQWHSAKPPHEAVSNLFENYVHDSRAWFKPFADPDDLWIKKQEDRIATLKRKRDNPAALQRWEEDQRKRAATGYSNEHVPMARPIPPLTEDEKLELSEYERTKELSTQKEGREPFHLGGGYLRLRCIYCGSDRNMAITSADISEVQMQHMDVA